MNENEIKKYIFNPKHPKQCKSYKLLLNIAKKENMVYLSSNFLTDEYQDAIANSDFEEELWDKPENYTEMNIFEKIEYFKELLTTEEYFKHLNRITINPKNRYTKIFDSFFYLEAGNIISYKEYRLNTIKYKLINLNTSFYIDLNLKFNQFHKSKNKIIFTNNIEMLMLTNKIYNLSSVVVTMIKPKDFFENFSLEDTNIKPIFLNSYDDLHYLLNILYQDLSVQKYKNEKREIISLLDKVDITNFYSMKDIELKNLADKKEIYIVGENGDGKTLLLQAIAIALKGVEEGDVFDFVKSQKDDYTIELKNTDDEIYKVKNQKNYKNFFAYGAFRNTQCFQDEDKTGYLSLFNNKLDLVKPSEWLIYLDHSDKSDKPNVLTANDAKRLICDLLNKEIDIEITPDGVVFSEKGSTVSFEQLSAGYKGVITIVADLLTRLAQNQPYVMQLSDFKGIVFIDEIELHLHPKWKYDFVKKLRTTFPKIQFMFTTHSPTVILGADKEAVFYKIYKKDGLVFISQQMKNEGYTTNSLISSPLFDLESITSRDYDKQVSNDDYIYTKIHKAVSDKISNDASMDDKEILDFIHKQLDEI